MKEELTSTFAPPSAGREVLATTVKPETESVGAASRTPIVAVFSGVSRGAVEIMNHATHPRARSPIVAVTSTWAWPLR